MSGKLSKKQVIMVAVLICGAALAVLNQTTISPVLPSIMDTFAVSSSTAQWLVSGYSLVSALVIPVTAYLMKRFPTRALYLFSIALFAAGSILCAAAPSFFLLMVGRVLQAICAGVLLPLATNVMLLVFPPERRGFAMGLYSLVACLMPAIGPAVAGVLADMAGWRALYLCMTALAVAVAAVALLSLKNYGAPQEAALDVSSVALSALGLTGLLYGFSDIGNNGLGIASIACIVVGLGLMALFVLRQRRLRDPLLDMSVFGYRRFSLGTATVAVMQLATTASAVTIPLVVQTGLGASAAVTGLVFLPSALCGAGVSLVAGRLFDRMGVRPLALAGCFLMVAGYAGMMFVGPSLGVWWVTVCMVVANVGMMLATAPLNAWSLGFLPDRLIPHGNAMSNTLRQVATSIGTALFVSLMAQATAWSGDPNIAQACLDGAHIAFGAQAAIFAAVLVFAFVCVRDGNRKKASAQ